MTDTGLSKNALRTRRKYINRKIRDDPKWASIFSMYDSRMEAAIEGGDYEVITHIKTMHQRFVTLIREDYERTHIATTNGAPTRRGTEA